MVAAASHKRARTPLESSKIWMLQGQLIYQLNIVNVIDPASYPIVHWRQNLTYNCFRLAAKMALAHQGLDIGVQKTESKRFAKDL